MPGLTIDTKLPGEALIVAIINLAEKFRSTQDTDVRRFWDLVAVEMQTNWRKVWADAGMWERLTDLDEHIAAMKKPGPVPKP